MVVIKSGLQKSGSTRIYAVGKSKTSLVSVIPKAVKDAYNIGPGDTLVWSLNYDTGRIEIIVWPSISGEWENMKGVFEGTIKPKRPK